MKRLIQTLQVAIFLLMISMPMLMQAGTITSLTPNIPCYIDIAANSKVRFTYKADIAPLGQQTLVFLEVNATGTITGSVGSFSGYGSGTVCTTLSTGKAAVVLSGISGGTYTIQYYADSPLAVNGDLGVAGNENVYGNLTVMNMLGVGTATPSANLHVVGTSPLGISVGNSAPLTKIQNNIYGNQFYVNDFTVREVAGSDWHSASYLRGINIDNLYSTPSTLRAWIKQKPYDQKIEFGSSGSTYMSVGSNVGIGTTSPSTKAQVNGTLTVDASGQSLNQYSEGVRLGAASNGYSIIAFAANPAVPNGTQANQWWVGKDGRDNGFNIWGNTPGDAFHILPSGYVGLGTITPSYNLDVVGNIKSRLAASANATGIIIGNNGSEQAMIQFNASDNSARFKMQLNGLNTSTERLSIYAGPLGGTASNEALAIAGNGKVSIGTATEDLTTGVLLTVNGTIHAKEVLVDINAPLADFVFNKSYKLMPLNQVEQYVNANSHLPEIPSASEVKEKGMNMGDMQNKLLQKVEELTLYAIELQKQVDELKASLNPSKGGR
jgi:hypothetical protein